MLPMRKVLLTAAAAASLLGFVAPSPSRAAGDPPDVTLRCWNRIIDGRAVNLPEGFVVKIWLRTGLVFFGTGMGTANIGEDGLSFALAGTNVVDVTIDRNSGNFFTINLGDPRFPKTSEGECSLMPNRVF